MKTELLKIIGNWDLGYALDKHTLSSVYTGDDEYGHPKFDTTRTEVGEATFRLKYRQDWTCVEPLAAQLAQSVVPLFKDVGFIVPMPPSRVRARQPVLEVANALGKIIGVPVFENIVVKVEPAEGAVPLKDLVGKDAKAAALVGRFKLNHAIGTSGKWNALLVDDLFDTGASLEAACTVLRQYEKVSSVYVATLTWK